MKSGSRYPLELRNVTTSFDPRGSTIELSIDGTWHPMTWKGEPNVIKDQQGRDRWVQDAATSGSFAGPSATPNGATVLGKGRHLTLARITDAARVVVFDTFPIDVQD